MLRTSSPPCSTPGHSSSSTSAQRAPALPVCRRARAWRCRKVRGAEYCGYCAAKQETVALWAAFGWRLHLVVTPAGVPVSFDLLPATFHDLTPVHELMERLLSGACVYADKGYNSADDQAWIEGEIGIRLVPRRRENMAPNTLAETFGLARYRGRIETVNSQLEAWGGTTSACPHARRLALQGIGVVIRLLCVNAD